MRNRQWLEKMREFVASEYDSHALVCTHFLDFDMVEMLLFEVKKRIRVILPDRRGAEYFFFGTLDGNGHLLIEGFELALYSEEGIRSAVQSMLEKEHKEVEMLGFRLGIISDITLPEFEKRFLIKDNTGRWYMRQVPLFSIKI